MSKKFKFKNEEIITEPEVTVMEDLTDLTTMVDLDKVAISEPLVEEKKELKAEVKAETKVEDKKSVERPKDLQAPTGTINGRRVHFFRG
jgi:hypothetical protein